MTKEKDDRKAVYVRMSEKTHRKLMRLVAAQMKRSGSATKQGVIIDLIEQAKGA
jgi:glycine cleavage system H lipoate-binding protein